MVTKRQIQLLSRVCNRQGYNFYSLMDAVESDFPELIGWRDLPLDYDGFREEVALEYERVKSGLKEFIGSQKKGNSKTIESTVSLSNLAPISNKYN